MYKDSILFQLGHQAWYAVFSQLQRGHQAQDISDALPAHYPYILNQVPPMLSESLKRQRKNDVRFRQG
jgi:hypothetical protein